MRYRTEEGFIEVFNSSKGEDYRIIFENGDVCYGKFVFCNPAPTELNFMNDVQEPIGAVMVFWFSDSEFITPSFITSEILEILE